MESNINLPSWYRTRREDEVILRALSLPNGGMRALCIFGPAGRKGTVARAVAGELLRVRCQRQNKNKRLCKKFFKKQFFLDAIFKLCYTINAFER